MSSTYSTSLQIQLIADGEQSGIWGATTNTNWNLIEQAVAGVASITMTNANYTLTVLNGISDEARNMVLVVGGTNSAIRQIIAPLVNKMYVVFNNTSGGYAITVGGATGTTVSVPNGVATIVYCDGTNFYSGFSGTSGTFTASSFTGAGTGLTGTAAGLSIGGNAATATTATSATNATTVTNGVYTTGSYANPSWITSLAASKLTGTIAATQITNAGGWNVTPSGTNLYFNYNGTNVGVLDSSGNLTVIGNVTAYGTV